MPSKKSTQPCRRFDTEVLLTDEQVKEAAKELCRRQGKPVIMQ